MQDVLTFPFRHGGARKNAGRKRGKGRRSVEHRRRESIPKNAPVHVTLRVSRSVGNLRSKRRFQPIKKALRDGAERFECRLVHFSVQKNHLHLLVEPRDRRSLMRAMKGLQVRLARRLNTALRRRGQVFSDRYHAHVLRTPREARHAIAYVLLNARKHAAQGGHVLPKRWIDPYSSARWFEGFENAAAVATDEVRIGGPPGVWLLQKGWRHAGPIFVEEVPGGRMRGRR
ncbi:MAG: transposase [Deltaproteobacteria bacterium]